MCKIEGKFLIDIDEIYKVMNEPFMGHDVDGVIIAKPVETTPAVELFFKIFREKALEDLEAEARLVR